MPISLKDIQNRVSLAERYITTDQANNYIANSGTVSSTNNLAGLPLSHYNCGGSCSWSCSGTCVYGAGGGTFTPTGTRHLARVTGSLDDAQGAYIDLVNGLFTVWVENDRRANVYEVLCIPTGERWASVVRGNSDGWNPTNGYDWIDPAKRITAGLWSSGFAIPNINSAGTAVLTAALVSGRTSIQIVTQPSNANRWTGEVLFRDVQSGSSTMTYDLFVNVM